MNGKDDPRVAEIWRLVRELVADRLEGRAAGARVEARLAELELGLPSIRPYGDATAVDAFARSFDRRVELLLDEAMEHVGAFRPGRVYCHRCADIGCEHAQPPGPRHVCAGYGPTGLPLWEDFGQFCLDRRHPDVDRLFDDPPALLTVVQPRSEVQAPLLEAYHGNGRELLGQLTAGFFRVPSRAEEGRGVLALTFQVTGAFPRRGRPRVGLNVLGQTPAGEPLERLWERQQELPWHRSIQWARTAVGTLVSPRSRRGGRPEEVAARLETRVVGILRGLSRRLERDSRARSRRTQHAQHRHRSGERPTGKAVDDARAASGDSLLIDERSGTWVVLGERGRTHFFTPEGQHVSSVRYSREAIARKLKLELWVRPSSEQTDSFRQQIG